MYEYLILGIAIAFCCLLLAARRIERSFLTMPLLCMVFGLLLHTVSGGGFPVMQIPAELIAEITLAIVLFSDASHLSIRKLRMGAGIPLRMLLVGMPLSVLIGSAMFMLVSPDFPIWEIILLAALLTPTDAALGDAIFSNKAVPEGVRDSLLAESGLNDGFALPFIIFAACAAVGGNHDLNQNSWVLFAITQIVGGIAVGAVLGWLGGVIVEKAIAANWARTEHGALASLMLVAIVFLASHAIGGNSFVSVFVAGMVYGGIANRCAASTKEFLEQEGMALNMLSFAFIGAVLLPDALTNAGWQQWLIAVLALCVVRPLAIFLSLSGTGTSGGVKLFYGWFGPRGLATALFGIFVLAEFDKLTFSNEILWVVSLAVALSALLHGISAHFAGALLGQNPRN